MPLLHRQVAANGISHHVVEQGEGPLVLLLHGFPEGWYSWRHQLAALADAGYRAVAPDVRGYGRTDAPPDIDQYDMRTLVADAAALVEALGAPHDQGRAIVVGHDWGAAIAWHCALLRPDRFRAVAALSIPFTPRPAAPPLTVFERRFPGAFFYMLYFQEPGVAEAELEADVRRSLRLFYYAASGDCPSPGAGFVGKPRGAKLLDGMIDPKVLPPWLTEADLDVYAAEFARSGFRGALNRYRNLDRDWHALEELADPERDKVRIPALFVGGDRDLTMALSTGSPIERMKAHVPDLRGATLLPGAGHWTQQERPEETSRALVAFAKSLPT